MRLCESREILGKAMRQEDCFTLNLMTASGSAHLVSIYGLAHIMRCGAHQHGMPVNWKGRPALGKSVENGPCHVMDQCVVGKQSLRCVQFHE